jgi:two-component system, chemotaxis family, sensor kinase CheA
MSDTTSGGPRPGAGIDLSQFYQVFFEEARENLDRMEKLLLGLDIGSADDEALNAIFRCAHSIKGGAATFGFADTAELTHQMETLLDRLRRRERAPTAAMVDVLLRSGDALRAQLARHQGAGGDAVDTAELLREVRALAAAPATPAAPASGQRVLELRVGPLRRASDADDLHSLFAEIPGLGTLEPLDGGQPSNGIRRFRITTTTGDGDLLDLFTFHVAREQLTLLPAEPGASARDVAPLAEANARPSPQPALASPKPAARSGDRATAHETPTLRVSVDKVDQLINLVGELVITQAMVAQESLRLDPTAHRQLTSGLADLERNTRQLQESVMSIRMIPMSVVFSRFPRMLRDLAAKLGKQVDFVTQGEATELDKGMVERITDPLTHLVRNACDHGIELPAERLARGKPGHGTIALSASQRGGSILIEVRDDGRGLSRDKLLAKARQKGIDAPDSLSDGEVWALIFAPGFTTAEEVTDVSGRGVGMDVVRRNIGALGGTVEIDSVEGRGMRVSVRLPLTLAIMDGMSIGVGDEVYIVPLCSVIESFRVQPAAIRSIGGSGRVVEVRSEFMPVLELERVLAVPRPRRDGDAAIVVVVEAEEGRVALLVDELLGQQQIVVKNLETNYRKVEGVSGATILGDGRVALILDVASLVRRSRH